MNDLAAADRDAVERSGESCGMRAYDRASPDEYRIDPHSDVIPFESSVRDG